VSLDQLKLNKQLVTAAQDAGITSPKELQQKAMSRILGGQDIVGVGPEGSGKTTTYVLATLMKLKFAFEEAPRALVLTHDKESALAIEKQFELLGKNTNLRTMCVLPGQGMETQREELAEGVDIVIGTPDRVLTLLLQNGLNMNKVKTLVLDNAEGLIQQGFKTPIHRIAVATTKCQNLVFGEVVHSKFNDLVNPILKYTTTIEVAPELNEQGELLNHQLYHVPNFSTKQNLLRLLFSDYETYRNVVIFVNTRLTAAKLYSTLNSQFHEQVAMLKPLFYDQIEVDSIPTFLEIPEMRALLVANEDNQELKFEGVEHIIHFDMPTDIDLVIDRLKKTEESTAKAISFVTDLELPLIKRIEFQTSQAIETLVLPEELKIEGQRKKSVKKNKEDAENNPAFHERLAKNTKEHNYGTREKRKQKGKVSKRRNYD
jgi:ATP-dependent RNA helicase RhlE